MLRPLPINLSLELSAFYLLALIGKFCYIQVQNVLSELEFLPLINIAFVTYFLNLFLLAIWMKQIPQFYIQSELMVEHITGRAMQ